MLRTLSLSLDPYCIAISGPFDKEHGFFLASSGIGTRIFSVIRWSSEFTSERTSQTGSSMVPGITSTQNLGNVNSTIPVPWCDFTWCDSMCQVRLPDRLVFSRHLEVGKGWGFINRWTVHGALSGGHKSCGFLLAWDAFGFNSFDRVNLLSADRVRHFATLVGFSSAASVICFTHSPCSLSISMYI